MTDLPNCWSVKFLIKTNINITQGITQGLSWRPLYNL